MRVKDRQIAEKATIDHSQQLTLQAMKDQEDLQLSWSAKQEVQQRRKVSFARLLRIRKSLGFLDITK